MLVSLPLPWQTALASLFMWVFITSGLVSNTQLYTRAHSAPHLDTHQWPFSVGQEASVSRCEACIGRRVRAVPFGTLRRPATVLNEFRHLRTFQFLPGLGDQRPIASLEASRSKPHTHPNTVPPLNKLAAFLLL